MSKTEAQEEFQRFVNKNSGASPDERNIHPEDRTEHQRDKADAAQRDNLDEEDQHRAQQIDAAMRIPGTNGFDMQLPPASFDSGRATGVKGVIADARSYETARKTTWKARVRQARRSVFGGDLMRNTNTITSQKSESDDEQSLKSGNHDDDDEESFLSQWRESRRRELESETRAGSAMRTRRTSPSVRMFGRLDTVDALGYLDAIEKVGRETVVVVFVYDKDCQVSAVVEEALKPLVSMHPAVHFVKVHYDDIEFDNAAVPTILAYRNQGDLFANLTGLIEMMPADDSDFTSSALKKILKAENVL